MVQPIEGVKCNWKEEGKEDKQWEAGCSCK